MRKCAICNNEFSDGVQCSACGKQLDFSCAGVTEAGWRRLGTDRRSVWRCPPCKTASSAPLSPIEPDSSATILKEIREIRLQMAEFHEIKAKLDCLPNLLEEIKSMKADIADLKKSCNFSAELIDDLKVKSADTNKKVVDLEGKLFAAEDKINNLNSQLSNFEQRSRLNNVEIKGVPSKKDENLFQIAEAIGREIGYSFPKTQINYISRVPTYNSKEKAIVICFLNRYIKEDFISAARNHKLLKAEDLGFHGSQQRVFVNDHLNSESKQLLNKVKQIAREKNYAYVWVKFGKIHVRKNDNSGVFIVNKLSDLNKFV